MTNKSTLLRKIDAFLKDRRKGNSGYAEVTPQDMEELDGVLTELLKLKFATDADGDLPVEVFMVDRTRFEKPFHLPVRYAHKAAEGMSEFDLHQEAAESYALMAKVASEQASRHLQATRLLLLDATRKQAPLQVQGTQFVVRPPEGVTLEKLKAELHKEVVKAYKKSPCPVEFEHRMSWCKAIVEKLSKKFGVYIQLNACRHTVGGVQVSCDVPVFSEKLLVTM